MAIRHLGLVWGIFGPPLKNTVLCGLYHCAKFGCNWYSSFDKMKVSIFSAFDSKIPKIVFFCEWEVDWPPKWVAISTKPQKAHPRESSYESLSVKICRLFWLVGGFPKKALQNFSGYISPICPQLLWTDLHQIWYCGRSHRHNYTCKNILEID